MDNISHFKIEFSVPEVKAQLAKFFTDREIHFKEMVDEAIDKLLSTENFKLDIERITRQALSRIICDEVNAQAKKYEDRIKDMICNEIDRNLRKLR